MQTDETETVDPRDHDRRAARGRLGGGLHRRRPRALARARRGPPACRRDGRAAQPHQLVVVERVRRRAGPLRRRARRRVPDGGTRVTVTETQPAIVPVAQLAASFELATARERPARTRVRGARRPDAASDARDADARRLDLGAGAHRRAADHASGRRQAPRRAQRVPAWSSARRRPAGARSTTGSARTRWCPRRPGCARPTRPGPGAWTASRRSPRVSAGWRRIKSRRVHAGERGVRQTSRRATEDHQASRRPAVTGRPRAAPAGRLAAMSRFLIVSRLS